MTFTVTCFDSSRQSRAITFNIEHAVVLPEDDAVDPLHAAGGEIIQLLAVDAIDATVTTDPK